MANSLATRSTVDEAKGHLAVKSVGIQRDGQQTRDGIVLIPQPSQDPDDPLVSWDPCILNCFH
ncbi:hypothetical protein BO94DRAFT_535110 [Aspergillus sclerotioniger CBS 115572]|uniref:Uncharacterized protein n=1 Tax=Aspergillus sclerotioniger CBS 115572 TaxID=1450535 RepID=A0A317WSI1_9EURO|nr:hypothetical protein BO94DRAFT_535110 [Aspergillus sclerotioniger CBS 115572]PWY88107.1 hypothetical protein BO94DRAFT_535110 [Aspergillus sclerotioniger CBS 115572]